MKAVQIILPILAAAAAVEGFAINRAVREASTTSSHSTSTIASSTKSASKTSSSSAAATTKASSTSSAAATLGTPVTTTASATPSGPYQSAAFISSILEAHNSYRAIHGGAEVVWDNTKAQYAQEYADKCVFEHSGGAYGENLAIGGYSDPTDYIWMWYDERTNYASYSDPDMSDFEEWGHFTQVVWDATTSIGCGFASSCTNLGDYGPYYLVCEYNVGNVLPAATFADNVLEPSSAIPDMPADMD